MDIVYVLGTSGKFRNNIDLRYSIRSVEQNLIGYDNIYIIGPKPDWLAGVVNIPAKDQFDPRANREANIINKALIGASSDCSDDFLFFNDDYFIHKKLDVAHIKNWHRGFLREVRLAGAYGNARIRTADYLESEGYTSLNYDGHYPAIFNKYKLLEIMDTIPWRENFYVFKSLYFNIMKVKGEYFSDFKIRRNTPLNYIKRKLQTRPFFSASDDATAAKTGLLLKSMFPNPSTYEINTNT